MGISYKAAIFVGLPRSEIYGAEKEGLIESEELEICPPWYDGSSEDQAIAGFQLASSQTYQAASFEWDQTACDELKKKFKELTGLDAKVWISPYGY